MIHRIRKGTFADGKTFHRAVHYVANPNKGAELVSSTFGADEPLPAIVAGLNHDAALNPRCSKPMFHAVLSLRSGETSETLSLPQWQLVVRRYLDHLGFGDCSFVAFRHNNTATEHVHVIASRVRPDGTVVKDFQDHQRGVQVLNSISQDLGLTTVREPGAAPVKALTLDEISAANRKLEPNLRLELQSILREAARDRPPIETFADRLSERGVTLRRHTSNDGAVRGLSYEIDGIGFKASDIGRDFTPTGLQRAFGIDASAPPSLPPTGESPIAPSSPIPSTPVASDPRLELRDLLRRAALDSPDFGTFLQRAAAHHIAIRPTASSDGTIRGLSYEFRGSIYKASDVGRDLTPVNLARRFAAPLVLPSSPPAAAEVPPGPHLAPPPAFSPPGSAPQASPAAPGAQLSPSLPPGSSWSPQALQALDNELRRTLTLSAPDLARSLQTLRSDPSSVRSLNSAWSIALASTNPRSAIRLLKREAIPSAVQRSATHLLGLAAAFVSPRAALAYSVRLLLSLPASAASAALRSQPRPSPIAAEVQANDASILRAYCTAAAADRPSWQVFEQRLRDARISVAAAPANGVRPSPDLLFNFEPRLGRALSSSDLGSDFTLRGLERSLGLRDVPVELPPVPSPPPLPFRQPTIDSVPDTPVDVIERAPSGAVLSHLQNPTPGDLENLGSNYLVNRERQADITIVPRDPNIQVLNVHENHILSGRAAGWEPCLIAPTAGDTYTVWIRHPIPEGPDPATLSANLRATAAAAFGVDPRAPVQHLTFTDPTQLFRSDLPNRPAPSVHRSPLPDLLAAQQQAVHLSTNAELQRLGLPSFAEYRNSRAATYSVQSQEWIRMAHQRGAHPFTILRELSHANVNSPIPAAGRISASLHRLARTLSPGDLRLFLQAVHPVPQLALRTAKFALSLVKKFVQGR